MNLPIQITQSVSKPVLSVLFTVLFSMVISAEEADGTLSTDAVLPAGTRLVIPQGIVERYQAESHSWSWIFTYFFINYFVTAPSRDDKRKETTYVPLSLEDGTKGIILWVDGTKIYWADKEKGVFGITDDIKLSDLCCVFH